MKNKVSFWADTVAADAAKKSKKNIVCTGITPSGHIHIGNMREVLTGDAVYRSLKELNNEVEFVYIADSFDSLRKVYPFLDAAKYEEHVGKPLSDIPCPCGEHENYAEHFLDPFLKSMKTLGVNIRVVRADKMYYEGKYADSIMTALENRDKIAQILTKHSGKPISEDWSPVNPKCSACGRITMAKVTGYDVGKKTVDYNCECGHSGTADATKGEAKLTWRVDWPARWAILGVTVEPFGKDHASRGGSYDTGRQIAKDVFGYDAPLPVIYEWISLKGKGDMSSSKGNVITISDMLEVVPPDVLRYYIYRAKPKKSITFDPGIPMLTLVDELDDDENKNRNQRAVELSTISPDDKVGIPFKHLVNIVQIASRDNDKSIKILKRSGYEIKNSTAVKKRLDYAKKWLDAYASDDMKFFPLDEMPEEGKNLSDIQKKSLKFIGEKLTDDLSGEDIHALFYDAKNQFDIDTKELFKAIYTVLIGKERGPRAGWFIKILGADFVSKRFNEF